MDLCLQVDDERWRLKERKSKQLYGNLEKKRKDRAEKDKEQITLNLLTLTRWKGEISVWGPETWQRTSVGRTGQWLCSMDAHSLLQDTHSGNPHLKAPDTSLHYDTHLAHTCPAVDQTHIDHLGVKNEKNSLLQPLLNLSRNCNSNVTIISMTQES